MTNIQYIWTIVDYFDVDRLFVQREEGVSGVGRGWWGWQVIECTM